MCTLNISTANHAEMTRTADISKGKNLGPLNSLPSLLSKEPYVVSALILENLLGNLSWISFYFKIPPNNLENGTKYVGCNSPLFLHMST